MGPAGRPAGPKSGGEAGARTGRHGQTACEGHEPDDGGGARSQSHADAGFLFAAGGPPGRHTFHPGERDRAKARISRGTAEIAAQRKRLVEADCGIDGGEGAARNGFHPRYFPVNAGARFGAGSPRDGDGDRWSKRMRRRPIASAPGKYSRMSAWLTARRGTAGRVRAGPCPVRVWLPIAQDKRFASGDQRSLFGVRRLSWGYLLLLRSKTSFHAEEIVRGPSFRQDQLAGPWRRDVVARNERPDPAE